MPEGLWRVSRAAPSGVSTLPWDSFNIPSVSQGQPEAGGFALVSVCERAAGSSIALGVGISATAAIPAAGENCGAGRQPGGSSGGGAGPRSGGNMPRRSEGGGLIAARSGNRPRGRRASRDAKNGAARGHAARRIRRLFATVPAVTIRDALRNDARLVTVVRRVRRPSAACRIANASGCGERRLPANSNGVWNTRFNGAAAAPGSTTPAAQRSSRPRAAARRSSTIGSLRERA